MDERLISDDVLRAWMRGADLLVQSGVAIDSAAVCPITLSAICREVLEMRAQKVAVRKCHCGQFELPGTSIATGHMDQTGHRLTEHRIDKCTPDSATGDGK